MIVYLVTFKNGKQYVGATSRTLATRRSDHKAACAAGVKNKFYNALRKHGIESTSWAVVSTHASAQEMFAAEVALIKSLSTQKLGYNTTSGGQGNPGRVITDENRAAISAAQRSRFARDGEREKSAKYLSDWKARDPSGFAECNRRREASINSDRVRKSISETLKQRLSCDSERERLSTQARKLYDERPYVKERISRKLGGAPIQVWRDGILVATYPTLSECARQVGASLGNIGMVIAGKRTHAKGFQFKKVAEA